ncbi:aldose epimerase family protein [Arcticibacter tournemirensis]|uniref:Aldose 1-epimerase n=1 Tax=Arcticibacter tournemirensis TaxID=699437 RepID=A0A4Q0MCX6_9SPHI|nr:aldose epimerase family protein [Arcticibacter tournemirensis]RXF71221.1 galactose mutarotase [Arcticibacter tournemirensis]
MNLQISSNLAISSKSWGQHEGEELVLFKIENKAGAYVELTNYGASVVSIVVPDKHNKPGNVVLGFPGPEGYVEDSCYIGATVGRFANRIAGASFMLEGISWQLDKNEYGHSNHGGKNGFNSKVFKFRVSEDSVYFNLRSNDGDGGYPGNLDLTVRYQWTDNCELLISYSAFTDKLTVANFTNHSYFNLSGRNTKISNHELTVYSQRILELGLDYIPTGRVVPTEALALDGRKIKEKLQKRGSTFLGVNHYYILDPSTDGHLQLAAKLSEEESGRILRVYTTYPGLMVYTGDFLKSRVAGHLHRAYEPFDGLCLECQYYPDSPNHPAFPSTALKPGQLYNHQILFTFSLV